MATTISTISRRICRSVLSKTTTTTSSQLMPFSTTSFPEFHDSAPEFDSPSSRSPPSSPPVPRYQSHHSPWNEELLENGIETGIFRAILVGQVGQRPFLKMRNGKKFVLFPVGTGGNHYYENRDGNNNNVQWHRVCLHQEEMVDTAMKHIYPGLTVYVEGNLETRVFTDQMTGLTRQIREVAIRREGRIIFLGQGDEIPKTTTSALKNVGYF